MQNLLFLKKVKTLYLQEFIDNLKKNERYYIARVFDARGEKPKIIYYDAQTLEKVSKSTVEKGK